jgi:hypothetical protein
MVGFAGVTEILFRVGSLEGGVPAQLDNKSRAQTESRTEVHRRLKCRRPAMIENPNDLNFLALCAASTCSRRSISRTTDTTGYYTDGRGARIIAIPQFQRKSLKSNDVKRGKSPLDQADAYLSLC